MTAPVSTDPATHYTWGDGCDGWHLVQSDTLSIIEERMPPGSAERRHLHTQSRQFFYVLAGELTMEVDGNEHVIVANSGIEIAPGVPHQAINRSDGELRFLVISQPPSHGDRTNL